MLHLYFGSGKGKTTAAAGLALRALGHGKKVVVVQFLKDGTSGEIEPLRRLGAAVFACPNAKFTWLMTPQEKAAALAHNTKTLETALQMPCDLLILDEACAALRASLLPEALLQKAVLNAPYEVVLTGRDPADWMLQNADYITEFTARRHPYEKGIPAREGIEY